MRWWSHRVIVDGRGFFLLQVCVKSHVFWSRKSSVIANSSPNLWSSVRLTKVSILCLRMPGLGRRHRILNRTGTRGSFGFYFMNILQRSNAQTFPPKLFGENARQRGNILVCFFPRVVNVRRYLPNNTFLIPRRTIYNKH